MKTTLNTSSETKLALYGFEDTQSSIIQNLQNDGLVWAEIWNSTEVSEITKIILDLENEFRYLETREIKKYANNHMYSDVNPYEVVRVVSDKCVEVRELDTVQTKFPNDFTPGGFVGHFADNRSGQDYDYISNSENSVFKIRWSEANRQWQKGKYTRFVMSDSPYKFHDYNF